MDYEEEFLAVVSKYKTRIEEQILDGQLDLRRYDLLVGQRLSFEMIPDLIRQAKNERIKAMDAD